MRRTMMWLAIAVLAPYPSAAQVGQEARPTPRSVRITMDTLHQLGGVPPGWMLTPPEGDPGRGRKLFQDLGCHTCHAVQGAALPAATGPGPELSGMGGHHPAGYFVESVLNPNAVIVDGPGFVGKDGSSTMPSYPEMTLAQLADLVAFLRSLTAGGMQHVMPVVAGPHVVDEADLPAPPPATAGRYLVQVYDIRPGQLAAFEDWFRREGEAQFLAEPGVLRIDTYVDRTRNGPQVMTVVAFKDEAALAAFANSPSGERIGQRFDDFIGPHGHDILPTLPLYRSPRLSSPASPRVACDVP